MYKMQVKFDFGANWKANMATRQSSLIFVSAQYFEKHLSYCFEIYEVY